MPFKFKLPVLFQNIWRELGKPFYNLQAVLKRKKWTVMIYMAADDINAEEEAKKFLEELNDISYKENVNVLMQSYRNWGLQEQKNYRALRFRLQNKCWHMLRDCYRHFAGRDFRILESEIQNKNPAIYFQDLGNIEVGENLALTDYITWCRKYFPAQNYLLLLWGHGTGSGMFVQDSINLIRTTKNEDNAFTLKQPNGNEIKIDADLKSLFELFGSANKMKAIITYQNNNTVITDEINLVRTLVDDTNDPRDARYEVTATENIHDLTRQWIHKHFNYNFSKLETLTHFEITKSLEATFGKNTPKGKRKIDLLVLMGCANQMVEFGYELKDSCRYLIASEELIWFEGYNYSDFISSLTNDPNIDAKNLGSRIISATEKKYNEAEKAALAISCVDLSKSLPLQEKIEIIIVKIMQLPGWKDIVIKARTHCTNFGERAYDSYIDVIWFFKKLKEALNDNSSPELKNEIEELIQFMFPTGAQNTNAEKKGYIIERYIGENKQEKTQQDRSLGGNGVSIYFPKNKSEHDENKDYKRGQFFEEKDVQANQFVKDSSWDNMVFQCLGIE